MKKGDSQSLGKRNFLGLQNGRDEKRKTTPCICYGWSSPTWKFLRNFHRQVPVWFVPCLIHATAHTQDRWAQV